MLIGGGGADTLNGGNGNDLLVYATGVTAINGGANSSTNLLTAGNRGDILSVSGTVDFTALGDVFEDIETISMLATDGSSGNSTITLDINDVLDMADSSIADPGGSNSGKTLTRQTRSASMAALATCSPSVRRPEPGSWQRAQPEFRRATQPTLT